MEINLLHLGSWTEFPDTKVLFLTCLCPSALVVGVPQSLREHSGLSRRTQHFMENGWQKVENALRVFHREWTQAQSLLQPFPFLTRLYLSPTSDLTPHPPFSWELSWCWCSVFGRTKPSTFTSWGVMTLSVLGENYTGGSWESTFSPFSSRICVQREECSFPWLRLGFSQASVPAWLFPVKKLWDWRNLFRTKQVHVLECRSSLLCIP